ncbi:MAG: hypothetical protein CMM74_10840 [Rhodospirillaceae bacterium]|jgi:hypothetical protein|nr:hypothetical protein [Rhodospirillaceae bacterium]
MIEALFVSGLDDLSFVNFNGVRMGPINSFNGCVYVGAELRQDALSISNHLIHEFDSADVGLP